MAILQPPTTATTSTATSTSSSRTVMSQQNLASSSSSSTPSSLSTITPPTAVSRPQYTDMNSTRTTTTATTATTASEIAQDNIASDTMTSITTSAITGPYLSNKSNTISMSSTMYHSTATATNINIDKRLQRLKSSKKPTKTTLLYSTTPSSSLLDYIQNNDENSDVDDFVIKQQQQEQQQLPVVSLINSNDNNDRMIHHLLNNIPSTLYPTYRPVPFRTKIALLIISFTMASLSTMKKRLFQQHWYFLDVPASITKVLTRVLFSFLSIQQIMNEIKRLISIVISSPIISKILVRTIAFMIASTAIHQELLLGPSRIRTQDLLTLPSRLSKLELVPILNSGSLASNTTTCHLNVHLIEYATTNSTNNDQAKSKNVHPLNYNLIYCNHGFGASSLSWLPVLPLLTKRINASIGLGHDAVGFGFTERPLSSDSVETKKKNLYYYSMDASATIGTELILSRLQKQHQDDPLHKNNNSIVLFGHSMGSLTTLRMVQKLVQSYRRRRHQYHNDESLVPPLRIRIVLVAPAFGVAPGSTRATTSNPNSKSIIGSDTSAQQQQRILQHSLSKWHNAKKSLKRTSNNIIFTIVSNPIIERLSRYGLRRIVGTTNFWKNGLEVAWGDTNSVSETDVLRYQWPSIGYGWEQGILNFVQSQILLRKMSKQQHHQQQEQQQQQGHDDFSNRLFIPDQELLQSVLAMDEVESVDIILGSKDKIVSPSRVIRFLKENNFATTTTMVPYQQQSFQERSTTSGTPTTTPKTIGITYMNNSGHNPFEEEIEGFVRVVERILQT